MEVIQFNFYIEIIFIHMPKTVFKILYKKFKFSNYTL